MNWVMFDMSNQNTLVALAYIKSEDNPLTVFCNYILYLLLIAPNQSLRADELKSNLLNRFGLDMPPQMIDVCIRILKKNKNIKLLPHGAGYSIESTSFDIKEFESTLLRLQQQEETVLVSITDFVNQKYKKNWSKEDAKRNLSYFLAEEGNGARLFLQEEFQIDSSVNSPSWYIGRYISHIQQGGCSLELTYLEDIINGMMIYQGVYQTNDYQQDKKQKFKGTTFYFDTKLILRALGYSWDAQVQATTELIKLITNDYEGRIGIFRQTLTEVKNALSRAGRNYNKKEHIVDDELQIYAELNPTGASLLLEASTFVEDRLKNEFGIYLCDDIEWNSPITRKNVIATTEIADYIKGKHNLWRTGTIDYDVEIINQINILRRSDYTIRYGGKNKLPVFITTNANLVFTFRDYVSSVVENDPSSKWNVHSLPIITDNMLLFRLWVPYAKKYANLPALTLARYAYAAQNPNTQYFEKLRDTAAKYGQENSITWFDLTEIRRQKLEDIIITRTNGIVDEITEDVVAFGINELIKMEEISLHNEVRELKLTVEERNSGIAQRDSKIVELYAKPFVNKLGVKRIVVWAAKIWWLFAMALLYVGTSLVNAYIGNYIAIPFLVAAIPGIFTFLLWILDKLSDKRDWHNFVLKSAVKFVWNKYVAQVSHTISAEDMCYKEEILEYCLSHTPMLERYRNYCMIE